jgi:hypothetical protein
MALVGRGVGAMGEGVGVLRPGADACEPGVGWFVNGAGAGDWVQLASHNPQQTSQPIKKTRRDFRLISIRSTSFYGCANYDRLSSKKAEPITIDPKGFTGLIPTAFQPPYSLSPSSKPSQVSGARHLHTS